MTTQPEDRVARMLVAIDSILLYLAGSIYSAVNIRTMMKIIFGKA